MKLDLKLKLDLLHWQNQMKPCPFCNSVVTLKQATDTGNILVVACEPESKCIDSGLGQYILVSKIEEAVAVWNSRPKPN